MAAQECTGKCGQIAMHLLYGANARCILILTHSTSAHVTLFGTRHRAQVVLTYLNRCVPVVVDDWLENAPGVQSVASL
jgi:hypothetical protein